MTVKKLLFVLAGLLLMASSTFGASVDDARKHMVRGMAAIEMAKSDDELSAAADEFRLATELAPAMASAWYNLGAVQVKLGQLQEAMASYKRYLDLSPNDGDARRVNDEIIKLEYKLEKSEKFKAKGGTWIDTDGSFYTVGAENGKLQVKGTRQRSRNDIDYSDIMIFNFGALGGLGTEQLTIGLNAKGNKLVGIWQVPSGKVYPTDVCVIPAEKGEVEGEFSSDGKMILRLMRSRYKIVQVEPPLGSVSCQEVSVIESRPVEMVFHGPLPDGGIRYAGVNNDGNFTVHNVDIGSNESAAGIEPGDEILAINDTLAKDLATASEKIRLIRGEIGTNCKLLLKKPGGVFSSDRVLTVNLKRSDLRK